MISDLYHYIGQKILVPLINGTIDVDLISKAQSYNLCKNISIKGRNMINRLRKLGHVFFYESVKLNVVVVEPLQEDQKWSLVTTEQFVTSPPNTYKLHVTKIMQDVTVEIVKILSVVYPVKVCRYFEGPLLGIYFESLKESDFTINEGEALNDIYVPIRSLTSLMSTKAEKAAKKRVLNNQTVDTFINTTYDESANKRKLINEISIRGTDRSKLAKRRGNPRRVFAKQPSLLDSFIS